MKAWHPLTWIIAGAGVTGIALAIWTLPPPATMLSDSVETIADSAPVPVVFDPGLPNLDPAVPTRPPLAELETFEAMIARPLFEPSRRLPEPVAERIAVIEAAPLDDRPDLELVGTIRQRGQAFALVVLGNGEVRRLAAGDMLEGWTVTIIDTDRLELVLDDEVMGFDIMR